MPGLGRDVTLQAFRRIWREKRGDFLKGIGPAGAPSRVRAAHHVSDCATILDVGCGPGVFLSTLQLQPRARPLERYAGTDPLAREMIEADLWNTTTVSGPTAITWHAHSAHDLEGFEDGEFEAVVVRHVLEHLHFPWDAVKEAARVCSRILVLVFSQWPTDGPRSILTDSYLKAARWAHPAGQLKAELGKAAFKMVQIENFNPADRTRLVPREAIWAGFRDPTREGWSGRRKDGTVFHL